MRTILIFLFALLTMGEMSCTRVVPLRDRLDTYTEAEKHKLKPGYKLTPHQRNTRKKARLRFTQNYRSQGGKNSPKIGAYLGNKKR